MQKKIYSFLLGLLLLASIGMLILRCTTEDQRVKELEEFIKRKEQEAQQQTAPSETPCACRPGGCCP